MKNEAEQFNEHCQSVENECKAEDERCMSDLVFHHKLNIADMVSKK